MAVTLSAEIRCIISICAVMSCIIAALCPIPIAGMPGIADAVSADSSTGGWSCVQALATATVAARRTVAVILIIITFLR
jgi:hypothetical protein